ncbi:hypothetical protein ABIA85_008504 [Bradyrhizobium sp. LA6.10]|uniref:type IV secretion system DNA-binding domain-containing protein n=1 Tax=Bradyrhizobium sp. LA6.10 TaxID=3156318 RepID=UPI00339A602E
MNNTAVKFRPALLVAFSVFVAIACIAYLSLFLVAPPEIDVLFAGWVPLNSHAVLIQIFRQLTGWRCLPSDGPLFVVCRMRWLVSIPTELARQPALATRLIVLASAPFVAAGIAFYETYIRTPPIETDMVKSGRHVLFGEYARRAIQAFIRRAGGRMKDGLWLLPNVQLSLAQAARNILVVGTQGSGKTGLLRAYIAQLLTYGWLTFVFDVKGDMVAGLPTEAFILVAPHDARTWALDLGPEVRNRAVALEFAAKCIDDENKKSMWVSAARAILADLAMVLHARHGDGWSWSELRDCALSSPANLQQALAEINAPSLSLVSFGADPAENRTVMSVLITMWVAVLATIEPLADAFAEVPAERHFTVKDWMASNSGMPKTLVFQKSLAFPELSGLLGSFLAERVATAALAPARRAPDAPRLALVLDEFSEIPIKRLPSLLSLGREMKVTTIASLQDLGQLKTIAGPDNAGVIESRFGIRLVLRLEPGDTIDRITRTWLGERRISRVREASVEELKAGITRPRETVAVPVVAPELLSDDLGVRKTSEGMMIKLLVCGFPMVGIVDVPLTTWPDRRQAHVAPESRAEIA